MSIDTWAVVVSTALSPLIAVLISRWLEDRKQASLQQHWVFTVLMGLRGATLNFEHVRALNVVQVEFHKSKPVLAAWRRFIDHLETRGTDDDSWRAWNEKHKDLLNGLLAAMARFLNVSLDDVDLRRGGYSPEAWHVKEAREEARLKVYEVIWRNMENGTLGPKLGEFVANAEREQQAAKRAKGGDAA